MSYKTLKEQFVSGNAGGSLLPINASGLLSIGTVLVWNAWLVHKKAGRRSRPTLSSHLLFAVEFAVIVLPQVLGVTVLSQHIAVLLAAQAAYIGYCAAGRAVPESETAQEEKPSKSPEKRRNPDNAWIVPPDAPTFNEETQVWSFQSRDGFQQPFVSVYRGQLMLMTIVCILAVDFDIFPRVFSKTETFGTSLMDMGVGSFVFSLGLVSARRLLRSLVTRNKNAGLVQQVKRRALPLLVLGLFRLAMVKQAEYPEHVTEYGVHWNFFFTLFALVLVTLCLRVQTNYIRVGLVLSLVHQGALSWGLESYVLSPDRGSLVSQNKEGLVSLPGYLAVFFIAVGMGVHILPPDPSFVDKITEKARIPRPDVPRVTDRALVEYEKALLAERIAHEKRKVHERRSRAWIPRPDKLRDLLFSYSVMCWALYYGSVYLGGMSPSRRLVNFPYIVWVAAYNVTYVFICMLALAAFESVFYVRAAIPRVLESLNRHSLLIFLLANVLTGLVNVSMETMYVPAVPAVLIILVYAGITAGCAYWMR